jgi:Skp family chaperone for outer membrane proteins
MLGAVAAAGTAPCCHDIASNPSSHGSLRVKRTLLVAAWITCGLIASAAQAQQQGRADVVLVDLSVIFQKYAGVTEMEADLKTAVQVAEAEIGKLREDTRKKLADLKLAQKGTPQYDQLQSDITRLQVEINMRATTGRKELADQEAKIIYGVYKLAQDEVANFCRRNGVRVALQFKSKALNEDDYTQLVAKLQQPVLYAEPSIDITPYVLEQLNARYAQRGGQAPGAPGPRR